MAAKPTHDDPFERAARKASLVERAQRGARSSARRVTAIEAGNRTVRRAVMALTIPWGVVVLIHGLLAGFDGWLFTGHALAFLVTLSVSVTLMFFLSDGQEVLGFPAGWAVVLFAHGWLLGTDNVVFALHLCAWAIFGLAFWTFVFLLDRGTG